MSKQIGIRAHAEFQQEKFALYSSRVLVVGCLFRPSHRWAVQLRRLYRLYLVPTTWTLPFLVSLRRSLARTYQ